MTDNNENSRDECKQAIAHEHNHDHEHEHGHKQDGPQAENMSFYDKITKILDHWKNHNESHAKEYRAWAAKAKDSGMQNASKLLEKAAEMTMSISEKLKEAASSIRK